MLKEIEIENFRCFRDRVRIPLAPLTLIYGPNLSGKTTILRALNLLKATFSATREEAPEMKVPTDDSDPFDLGGSETLANWRRSEDPIKFRLLGTPLRLPREPKMRKVPASIEPTGIELAFQREENAGMDQYALQTIDFLNVHGNVLLSLTRLPAGPTKIPKFFVSHCPSKEYWRDAFEFLKHVSNEPGIETPLHHSRKVASDVIGEQNISRIRTLLGRNKGENYFEDYIKTSEAWLRFQSFDPSENNPSLLDFQEWGFAKLGRRGDSKFRASKGIILDYVKGFVGDHFPYIANLQSFVRHALDCVRSPLVNLETIISNKKPAERWIDLEKQMGTRVGPRGENVARIIQDERILEEINKANEYMDLGFHYKVKKIDSVGSRLCEIIASYDNGLEVNIADEGFAASQLLPTLAQLAKSKLESEYLAPPNIVALEEPELHLYPELQFKFTSYLIKTVNQQNQRILDTHSEMSTYAILDRVRRSSMGDLKDDERALKPSDVSFISVQKDNEEGFSIPHHIEADEFGSFAHPWPGGFFSERLDRML
jgi:hypothetical protein